MASTRTRRATFAVASAALLGLAAACSSSPSNTQQSGSAKQTITFAVSGLGSETTWTEKQISEFEKANPNIVVTVNVLSSNSTTFLDQVGNAFAAGSPTPDIVQGDVTYAAKWAAAGYIQPVGNICNASQFNQAMISTGMYKGQLYACPYFLNTEGLYYRTDLVPTPPTSPQQVITDAQQALKTDHQLKEGIVFEGAKYEGAITAYEIVDRAFGGSLNNLSNVDTPQNVAALSYLHDLIYKYHVAPSDVVNDQEGQDGTDFTNGYAAFATNWPYLFAQPLAPVVKGHIGYIPFPAVSGGTPGVALGGSVLNVNAKTQHLAAVTKLIQFLTSPAQQTARAIGVADAPALPAAYTPALFAAAPVFKTVQTMAPVAAARPVSPEYLNVSADLQELISSVYANPSSSAASSAFQTYAPTIASDSGAS
jgi:multiple sugar transport system substrate-binding protein